MSALLSAYELQRQQRIADNQAQLQRLGLGVRQPSQRTPQPAAQRRKATAEDTATAVPLRRSARSRQPTTTTTAEPATSSEDTAPAAKRHAGQPVPPLPDDYVASAAFATALSAAAASTTPGAASSTNLPRGPVSCKDLPADIDGLLARHLGQRIPKIGNQAKFAVMAAASPAVTPRFNRMSGIQEWTNAVFLFVNIDHSSYDNVFLDNTTTVAWFAQPSQKPTTPVIQRLLHNGYAASRSASLPVVGFPLPPDPSAAAVNDAPPEPAAILLFCRLPDEPYVFFGRLALRLFDPSAQPLKFLWYLCDTATLKRPDNLDLDSYLTRPV